MKQIPPQAAFVHHVYHNSKNFKKRFQWGYGVQRGKQSQSQREVNPLSIESLKPTLSGCSSKDGTFPLRASPGLKTKDPTSNRH